MFGGAKWRCATRGPGTEWQGVWNFHTSRTPPPGARSISTLRTPLPIPTPFRPQNGGGWMGMHNSCFFHFFRVFLMFRVFDQKRPVRAVFLTPPGNVIFFTFFAIPGGSNETPPKHEIRPLSEGGTPAPYTFFIRSSTRFARPEKTRCESNF